VKYSFNLHFH